jgi:transcription elongation factor SPT6
MQTVEAIHVTYVDAEVARVWANSEQAKSEFADYETLLCEAICLGRYLVDPLITLASLCWQGGSARGSPELLCVRFHPLQELVSRDFLLEMLYRCFLNTVNAVGVDINRLMMHRHHSGLLQFVAGLGPRKAAGLIASIERKGGRIVMREELEAIFANQSSGAKNSNQSNERETTSCVYTNSIGFLRINSLYLQNGEELQLLDSTRIHPDHYYLAFKIAKDALEEEDEQQAIESIFKDPSQLAEMELDAFAAELEKMGKSMRSIVYEIPKELKQPFQDPRSEYSDPDPGQVFTMLTGETDSSLRVGQLVNVRVTDVLHFILRCRLESGLEGSIEKMDVSDRVEKYWDLREKLSNIRGKVIAARVKSVDKEALKVQLISKTSALNDPHWEENLLRELHGKEPYLRIHKDELLPEEERERIRKQAAREKRKQKKKIAEMRFSRMIEHPLFRNMNAEEAETFLKDKEIGEVVIRPSSQGYNQLTISWKFLDNMVVHVQVREEGKAANNPRSLGKILFIGDEKFDDLNEILARHIEPIVSFSNELVSFRNFHFGSDAEINQLLIEAKQKDPQRIPYHIHLSHDMPGRFALSYLVSATKGPKREFISVTPEGYRFRSRNFNQAEHLITWFKRDFQKARQSQQGKPASSSVSGGSSRHRPTGPNTAKAPSQPPVDTTASLLPAPKLPVPAAAFPDLGLGSMSQAFAMMGANPMQPQVQPDFLSQFLGAAPPQVAMGFPMGAASGMVAPMHPMMVPPPHPRGYPPPPPPPQMGANWMSGGWDSVPPAMPNNNNNNNNNLMGMGAVRDSSNNNNNNNNNSNNRSRDYRDNRGDNRGDNRDYNRDNRDNRDYNRESRDSRENRDSRDNRGGDNRERRDVRGPPPPRRGAPPPPPPPPSGR